MTLNYMVLICSVKVSDDQCIVIHSVSLVVLAANNDRSEIQQLQFWENYGTYLVQN
jgi:hypothetical protein